MNKNAKYTFGGINQDIAKSKHMPEYYFEADHIRVMSTDSQATGVLSNEKGNESVITLRPTTIDLDVGFITYAQDADRTINLRFETTEIAEQVNAGLLPLESGEPIVIGTVATRTGIIVFTTDGLGTDCIWYIENLLDGDYTIELLYLRNLGFSTENPIQAIFNYENDIIQKIYWVDGKNQLRFLNLEHSIANGDVEELIDLNSNTINFVGNIDFSQPVIDDIVSGGNHTSGMIQYAYNLYRLNSSQTAISPLSELVPLAFSDGLGGGDPDEIVGATPIVTISDIDPEYTHIRLYAIKYSALNQIPSINLILDREVGPSRTITYFDDGTTESILSLEEFLFLGSNPIIPQHIQTKDNILFSANIDQNNFDVDLDCRAYAFRQNQTNTFVLDNVIAGTPPGSVPDMFSGISVADEANEIVEVDNTFDVPEKFDCVNPNYNSYRFQRSSNTVGGTGKYIEYELIEQFPGSEGSILPSSEVEDSRFFKSNEIYRIGVVFYNKLGQKTFPKWIADIKAPNANLTGRYNILYVNFTAEFDAWLADDNNFATEDDRPVGYKIIRAERNQQDRSILFQGVITPTMFQVKGDAVEDYEDFYNQSHRESFQDDIVKIPSWATRTFTTSLRLQPDILGGSNATSGRVVPTNHLAWLNDAQNINNPSDSYPDGGEIHTAVQRDLKISQTLLHSKLMQFFSPEILFDLGFSKSGLELAVNGICTATLEGVRSQETFISTTLEKSGGKFQYTPTRLIQESNNIEATFDTPGGRSPRYIGPSGAEDTTDFFQFYREYGDFAVNTDTTVYEIYGKPELVTEGQGKIEYNGDANYAFINSLESFASDGNQDDCSNGDVNCVPIISINSWANKSALIVLGDATTDTSSRTGIEDLYSAGTFATGNQNGVLNVELRIPEINVYLGGLYGGNTYEDKNLNNYFEIGAYEDLGTTNNYQYITSPGDTYVGLFKFLRIGKTNTETLDTRIPQISEIVALPVETTVDLKNRNDLSLFDWDNRFQPPIEDYASYNTVYSQQPSLVQVIGEGSNFKEVENFDTRIYASKTKIPGEDIDSWTDILINEFQDMDGKYGPVNSLINFRDNLYTFQDEAIAGLSINPRVQVQGNDGVAIELGTGGVFYDVNYLTTASGSINKWGVYATDKTIYYYDALNRAFNRVPSESASFLSDEKGLHTYFNNNYDYSMLKVDNPILQSGALIGYDNFNKDVYLTLHQGDLSFTRVFNENRGEFIDKKLYYPTNYIYKGDKTLVLNPSNNQLYEQFQGEYNVYFDEVIPSRIILMVNPEADLDCIFNNIIFKSELSYDGIDQPNKTITHIRAYNEYQDSGRRPLISRRDKNLRRKFRDWRADIPRDKRNRMRNPWLFLELEYDNHFNGKLILHDIVVGYTI